MSDLIDTTEMYLRTLFELEEEGVVPMRARIRERLAQSGPTVSETVARMERDGLVLVAPGDHHLEFTAAGREAATRVMRKHRIAECMLVEVIGIPWEDVHAEACRWEHVMSDAVERRLLEVLGNPTISPYGNPIPGLDELVPNLVAPHGGPLISLAAVAGSDVRTVVLRRIAEPLQTDGESMLTLRRVGANPGASIQVQRAAEGILIGSGGEYTEVSLETAGHLLVDATP